MKNTKKMRKEVRLSRGQSTAFYGREKRGSMTLIRNQNRSIITNIRNCEHQWSMEYGVWSMENGEWRL